MPAFHRCLIPALVALALLSCVRNPATGAKQLSLVSQQEEVQLGQEAQQDIEAQLGLIETGPLPSLVSGVGNRVAGVTERRDLPWSFKVVDDTSVNAFALPGGPVYITRGMLAAMNSESELAAVLGHEAGHITARHTAQQLTKASLTSLGVGLGAAVLGSELGALAQLAGVGAQLMLLRYSRDAEREADSLGLRYHQRLEYNPVGYLDLFETLERTTGEASAGRLPGWISTHPDPGERLKTARERIARLKPTGAGDMGRDRYLRALDGLVYGNDPRQGFFRGSTFVHPDLRLQLTFPEGWKAQNHAAAVVGTDPSGRAALQLGIAEGATAEEALARFGQQANVRVGRTAPFGSGPLKGIQAVFEAQGEGGLLEGVVAFIPHAGKVLRLMGLTVPGGLGANATLFDRAFLSLAPLTDAAALQAQPATLRVEALPEAMSLAQFHARAPGRISLEELAKLNAVDPQAPLKAGALVKRVEGGGDFPQQLGGR